MKPFAGNAMRASGNNPNALQIYANFGASSFTAASTGNSIIAGRCDASSIDITGSVQFTDGSRCPQ